MTLTNNSRSNGFDVLRILAAVFVIVGHAYPLTGHVGPIILGNNVSSISVKVFFVISGFLITKSWMSNPNFRMFFEKRILRIFPALIVNILFSAFIIGPFVTSLPFSHYFYNESFFYYFKNIVLYPIYNLPGVFTDNIYKIAVNGSLWTLPIEFFMYIITPIFVANYKNSKISITFALIFIISAYFYYIYFSSQGQDYVVYGTALRPVLDVAPYFIIGMFWAVFNLEQYNRPIWTIIIFAIGALLLHNEFIANIFLLTMLPYLVISVGSQNFKWLQSIFHQRDYSYGIYLYAFPIQQLLVYLTNNGLSPIYNALYSFLITIFLAALSWHFIEKPALFLKKRLKRSSQ